MSLLKKLKAGTNNKKTINFPGTAGEVVLRVLSEAERQAAAFATEKRFEVMKIDPSLMTADVYESEKTTQLLFRALEDPEKEGGAIASNIDEFREMITLDEKDIIVDEYTALEQECSPALDSMSEEAVDELLESLKKKPEEIAGGVFNIVIAHRLILSLVNQLQSLQKDSGSTS